MNIDTMSKKHRNKREESEAELMEQEDKKPDKQSTGRKVGRAKRKSSVGSQKHKSSSTNAISLLDASDDDVTVTNVKATHKKTGKKPKKPSKKSRQDDELSDGSVISEPDTLPKDDSMYNVDEENDLGDDLTDGMVF